MCNKLQKIGKRIHISFKHMYQYSSRSLEYFVWPLLFEGSCGFCNCLYLFCFLNLGLFGVFSSFFRYLSGRFIIWLMDVFIITWHYDDKDLFFNYRYELHLEDLQVSLCNFFVFRTAKKVNILSKAEIFSCNNFDKFWIRLIYRNLYFI